MKFAKHDQKVTGRVQVKTQKWLINPDQNLSMLLR
jgi:hypothetical protein